MEDFVNFRLAQKLKEKGFEWVKITTYNPKTKVRNNHLEPTISQVLKWLRDEKGIHVCIALGEFSDWMYDVSRIDGNMFCKAEDDFKSYEQAVLAGIEYVLDNLDNLI